MFHKSNIISCPLLFALQSFPIIRCLYGVSQVWLLRKKLCAILRVFSSYQHSARYTVTSNLIELLPFNLSDNHMIETG